MGAHSFKKSRWESNPLFPTMSPVLSDHMALPGVVETPSTVRQTVMLAITPWEHIYIITNLQNIVFHNLQDCQHNLEFSL